MKPLKVFAFIFAVAVLVTTAVPTLLAVESNRIYRGPQALRDKESGTIFYVESDGRHVVAIDSDGKILWHRDPFAEAKLEQYRIAKPLISTIEYPTERIPPTMKGRFIQITFNSSQVGIMSFESGHFTFLGQD